MSTRLECIIPILRVQNLQETLRYYEEVLGFQRDWGGDADNSMIAQVSRDGCGLMFFQEGQGHTGTWIWVGVEDVEPLYREYLASGARMRMAPANFPWALEMRVEDLDGNVLRIGSEPRADLPFQSPPD